GGVPAVPAQAVPPPSSLDLLRAPDEASAPAGAAPAATPAASLKQQADAVNASAAGMLAAVKPLLDNPQVLGRLSPQMRRNVKELETLMTEIGAQASSGRKVSDAEQARRMQRMQALTMQIMSTYAASQAAPAATPAPAPEPHLVPADKLPPPGAAQGEER
ncbi:MAG: hypothetical protein KGM24_10940, partial [Elusimicrobia bacterium]|nr:hypothetical protein [Elusimicrobiota bacterium]